MVAGDILASKADARVIMEDVLPGPYQQRRRRWSKGWKARNAIIDPAPLIELNSKVKEHQFPEEIT